MRPCPLCGSPPRSTLVRIDRQRWTIYTCSQCGADFASPPLAVPELQTGDHFQELNLDQYERSVKQTRQKSYGQLLARVRRHAASGRWLDVGCSYGWLLERVQSEGFTPYGVEPSASAVAQAREHGLQVSAGVFPQERGSAPPYQVISFMDVLEHQSDPQAVLKEARSTLTSGGLLVIQVPDKSCMLYRLAKTLARAFGLGFALERLWLVTFAFPHLIYFSRKSLTKTLEAAGFQVLDFYRAPIGSPADAFSRVSYTEQRPGLFSYLVAAAVALINLTDNLSGHGGLMVVIARRRD